MVDFLQIVKSRRSTRAFKPEQIKDEELQVILEAGAYSPSANNKQPWHFTVIQNPHLIDWMSDTFKELAKTHEKDYIRKMANDKDSHLYFHAPTLILISGDSNNPYAIVDCAAATENMILAAEALGIGSCWVGNTSFLLNGHAKSEEYAKELGIPEDYKQMHSIILGYKEHSSATAPARKQNAVNFIK